MPDVYWLIGAQRRLLESQETTLAVADLRGRYEAVSRKLAATFAKAVTVLVRNLLRSYSLRSDQHILLVEVIWRSSPAALPHRPGRLPAQRGHLPRVLPDFAVGLFSRRSPRAQRARQP